jgi:hypothetical protein
MISWILSNGSDDAATAGSSAATAGAAPKSASPVVKDTAVSAIVVAADGAPHEML